MSEQDFTRFSVRIPVSLDADISGLASRLGLTKSAVINLAIISGLGSLRRAFEPEKMLSQEDWERILKAGQAVGVSVPKPE